jgi:nucleoid-associated protein YgaU
MTRTRPGTMTRTRPGTMTRTRPGPSTRTTTGTTVRPAAGTAGAMARRRPVRLTGRGRVVVLLVLVAVCVLGFSLGHVSTQAASSTGRAQVTAVTVERGETLWRLAQRVAPHTDPRLVVAAIERANHLHGAEVFAGQSLVVPVAH